MLSIPFSKWPVIIKGHVDIKGKYLVITEQNQSKNVFSFLYFYIILKKTNLSVHTIKKDCRNGAIPISFGPKVIVLLNLLPLEHPLITIKSVK